MVSPVKTWQHQEPKGLWPALSGLAVVTHVGVLGLSLPYMMELMANSGQRSAAVVPIELIEVEPDSSLSQRAAASPRTAASPPSPAAQRLAQPTEPAQSESISSPKSEPSKPTSDSVLTSESDPTSTVQSPQESEPSEATENKAEENNSGRATDSETSDSETPDSETGDTEEPEQAESPAPTSPTEPEDSEPTNSTNPQGNRPDAAPEEESEEEDETDDTSSEPDILPGDETLPAPGEGTDGESDEQTAYLDIVAHSAVPADLLRDITDTPPSPIYDGGTSLTLRPQSVGCGQVDFSQTRVTYRVAVNVDGTLRSATPWTGSIESRALSEGERAIACLLTTADFRFNPALVDGEPILNDNLLLTIDVIESRAD